MNSSSLYWVVFVLAFFAVAIWESLSPDRAHGMSTGQRWGNHALLYSVSAALQTVIVRFLPLGAAALRASSPAGLLNRGEIPFALRCLLTVLFLDFLQYWIHRFYHASSALWRIHEIHHSDPGYDVSTATRFHPLEILPTQAAHLAAILILAPPPIAVLAATLLSMLVNLSSHANAAFPPKLEQGLRAVLITPGLHRIHHSEDARDFSGNFGQTFTIWDRIFGTFKSKQAADVLVTGTGGTEQAASFEAYRLLVRPFRQNNNGS